MFYGKCAIRSKLLLEMTVLAAVLAMASTPSQGQVIFRCTNAAGVIVYTDKLCSGDFHSEEVRAMEDADSPERQAAHDAIVARDKSLAAQVEASRVAAEQAQRAAQTQQMQANKAASDRVEQERAARNAATVSTPGIGDSTPITSIIGR